MKEFRYGEPFTARYCNKFAGSCVEYDGSASYLDLGTSLAAIAVFVLFVLVIRAYVRKRWIRD